MSLGVKTIQTIGALGVCAALTGAFFLGFNPIKNGIETKQAEIEAIQKSNDSDLRRLEAYKNGAGADQETIAQQFAQFSSLITPGEDIESASRAIATALPSGVSMTSFTFHPASAVTAGSEAKTTLESFSAPADFAPAPTAAEESNNEVEDATGVNPGAEQLNKSDKKSDSKASSNNGMSKIPWEIEVTADSYDSLAQYLDNLSKEPRLISVVSIDTTIAEQVTAKIYAYAFTTNAQ